MVNQVMDRLNRPRPFDRDLFAAARLAALVSGLAVLLAASALLAPAASGADRVYWANSGLGGGAQGISFANLDGSGGGGDLSTAGATLSTPAGLTLDPAAGRVYWANNGSGVPPQGIAFANLDGSGAGGDLNTSGATVNSPVGLAIDHAAGRIYWGNNGSGTPPFSISFAHLDGSGGGDLNTAGATLDTPSGVVIDRPAGRIYWTNANTNTISFANLDGSGGDDLSTAGATLDAPEGLAIDPAAGRIYWANLGFGGGAEGISFANLDGSGAGGELNTAGAALNFPIGVSIDAAGGKLYWANSAAGGSGPQGISFANLDGSGGGGDLNTAGATLGQPAFPALLKAPLGSGAPKLSGAHGHRSKLSCTQGSWAPDQPEPKLFQAPSSYTYSWSRYAKKIHGANASTYRPHAVGNYRCTVAGDNPAGQALQTSTPHTAFRLAKVFRNKRRGTVKLIVKVPSRGKLTLSGAKLKKATRRTHLASKKRHLHKAALLIRAKGSAKRKLNRTGRVKLKLAVKFKPKKGGPGTLTRTVTLRLRLPQSTQNTSFPIGLGRGR